MSILDRSGFMEVVRTFLFLQSKLQEKFIEINPSSKDLKYLTDFLRAGQIIVQGDEWHFIRHGLGVFFENLKDNSVIDVHNLFFEKDLIDAHRISEFIHSMKCQRFEHINLFCECEISLKDLESAGLIKLIDGHGNIWKLSA